MGGGHAPARTEVPRVTDEMRERLNAERRRTEVLLTGLTRDFESIVEASMDSNADDEHDPDGSTVAFDRSQVDAMLQQTRHHLREIEAALERVTAGTYGTCESCGRPISAARLEARPVARQCIDCA